MNDKDDPWKRLVDATKTAPLDEEALPTTPVSVNSLRENVQSLFLALTWRKWSLLAAAIAGMIFLIVYLLREDPLPPQPIIPTEPPAPSETP